MASILIRSAVDHGSGAVAPSATTTDRPNSGGPGNTTGREGTPPQRHFAEDGAGAYARTSMAIVLFDVDGTLVDSRSPILTAQKTAFISLGLEPPSETELWPLVGPPLRQTMTTLLAARQSDPALVEMVIEAYRMAYGPLSVSAAKSFPGVPELVRSLAAGRRLGVVTSKPILYARPILEVLGLAEIMEVMEGPDLAETEPKSVTLARALAKMNSPGEPTVLVGDRRHDIEAAAINHIAGIGVTWGFGSRDELELAGAMAVVDDPADLESVLLDL